MPFVARIFCIVCLLSFSICNDDNFEYAPVYEYEKRRNCIKYLIIIITQQIKFRTNKWWSRWLINQIWCLLAKSQISNLHECILSYRVYSEQQSATQNWLNIRYWSIEWCIRIHRLYQLCSATATPITVHASTAATAATATHPTTNSTKSTVS